METELISNKQQQIVNALNSAINYKVYSEQMTHFFESKSTSGADQSEGLIEYTALNYQRMKRLDKTIKVDDTQIKEFQKLNKEINWLIITEAWCGDAAQVIPVLNKMAEATKTIKIKLAYRDQHPQLMDMFLTNGARSIPKLIALDRNHNILYTWGPRPSEATKMVNDFKIKNGSLTTQFKQDLQIWYNKNKGQGVIQDQLLLLNKQEK